jgi:hypothetical protein
MTNPASVRETLDTLRKVGSIAELAGIRGEVDEEHMLFAAGFNLPDDRRQMVYVCETGRSSTQSIVVTIFSPCRTVESGLFKGMSKAQAIDLLRKNEQMLFARYGLRTMGNRELVVASTDHLLETLDPEEFHAHVWHAAMAADAYERQHGKDEF